MTSRLASTIGVSVLSHVSLPGSRVIVPLIALQDGASPLIVGVLGALFTLLPMFFSAHLGRCLDRVGLRVPVIAACGMACAGALVGAAWPTTAALFIVAPLVGAGTMIVYLSSAETVGSIGEPAQRPRHFGLLALGYSGSSFGGPLIAGFAMEHIGRSGAFLLLAVFPLTALVVACLTPDAWRATPVTMDTDLARGTGLIDLLHTPRLPLVLVTSAMIAAGQNLFAFVIPIHATQHGLGPGHVGQVMAAMAIGAFAVRAALPLVANRLSAGVLLAGALLLSAMAYAALPGTTRAAPLMTLALLLGSAIGLVQPTVMSLLYLVSPPGRLNETAGLNVTMLTAAQTLVPLAFGIVGGAIGIGMVCWVFATALVVNASGLKRLRQS